MNGTDAVNLFLEICVVAGWVAEPIPETPDHESADFLVVTGRGRYFAEVKQLNANADEAIKEAEIEAGKIIVVHHEPGDRLRPFTTGTQLRLGRRARQAQRGNHERRLRGAMRTDFRS